MKNRLRDRDGRTCFAVVCASIAVALYFGAMRLASCHIIDNDAFFHIKLSWLYRQGESLFVLPWLHFTILRDRFVDQQFLYHLLNIPLTVLPLDVAARVSSVLWATAAFGLLLARLRVPLAWLWTLALLAVSWVFLYRMNFSRLPAMSVALQMAALMFLFERRFRLAAAVAFVYVWSYHLFVLLLPIAAIFTLVMRRKARPEAVAPPPGGDEQTGHSPAPGRVWRLAGVFEWRYACAVSAGIGLGLFVNPYFPDDLRFLYEHIVLTAMNPSGLPLGTEWRPYESLFMVRCCWGAFVVAAGAVFLAVATGTRLSRQARVAFLLMLMFLLAYLRSRRFIEYFPVYALLFGALAFRDLVGAGALRLSRALPGARVRGRPLAPEDDWRVAPAVRKGVFRIGHGAFACTALLVAGGTGVNWQRCAADLRRAPPPDRYKGAAEWIAANSQEGDIVFTTDWDDFPELFFHNHKNRYILGLATPLMYLHDKGLYHLWERLTWGKLEMPSGYLRRDFGARFVFSDRLHKQFEARAARDPGLEAGYKDANAIVWRVLPAATRGEERIEAEALYPPAAASLPDHRVQDFTKDTGVRCGGGQIVLFDARRAGDFIELAFRVPDGGGVRGVRDPCACPALWPVAVVVQRDGGGRGVRRLCRANLLRRKPFARNGAAAGRDESSARHRGRTKPAGKRVPGGHRPDSADTGWRCARRMTPAATGYEGARPHDPSTVASGWVRGFTGMNRINRMNGMGEEVGWASSHAVAAGWCLRQAQATPLTQPGRQELPFTHPGATSDEPDRGNGAARAHVHIAAGEVDGSGLAPSSRFIPCTL